MFKVLIAISFVLFPFAGKAETPEERRKSIEEIHKTVKKQLEDSEAQEALQEAAEAELSKKALEYTNYLIKAWALYNAVDNYSKAKTDTDRFNATISGIAAVWWEPHSRVWVQLGTALVVMNGSMTQAYYMRQVAEIQLEQLKLDIQIDQIKLREMEREFNVFNGIMDEVDLNGKKIEKANARVQNICNRDSSKISERLKFRMECLLAYDRANFNIKYQAQLLQRLLDTPFYYLSLDSFLKRTELKNTDGLRKVLAETNKNVEDQSRQLDSMRSEFTYGVKEFATSMLNGDKAIVDQISQEQCEETVSRSLRQVMNDQVQGPKDLVEVRLIHEAQQAEHDLCVRPLSPSLTLMLKTLSGRVQELGR